VRGLPLAALLLLGGCAPRPPAVAPPPPPPPPTPVEGAAGQTPPEVAELTTLLAQYRANKDAALCVRIGAVHARLGRLDEAVAMFQEAARLDPRHVPAHLGQGQVWVKLGRPGLAVEAYQQAARLMPRQPLIELELAAAYLDLRDFPAAERHAKAAERLDPKLPEVYRALGTVYSATGDSTATLAMAKKAIELAPEDFGNWLHAGGLCYGIRRFEDSVTYYRKALAMRPDDVDANINLAEALFQLDQSPERQRELQGLLSRALVIDPTHPRALYLLGRLYLDQNRLNLAVPTLRRAVRWEPDSHEVVLALGQALARSGATEEGRVLLARAQRSIDRTVDFRGLEFQAFSNPNPDVHFRLARLYHGNGQYDSALAAVRRGLRQTPGDPRLRRLERELLAAPPATGGPR
jgi:tetratricopeptide (TPR) repeat protein